MTMGNLAGLAAYAPSAYDILSRVGLERRRSRALRAATCAGYIGLGMAMGSGLFMFFNSRTGPVVRERLADTARRAREYVSPSEQDEQQMSPPQAPRTTRRT